MCSSSRLGGGRRGGSLWKSKTWLRNNQRMRNRVCLSYSKRLTHSSVTLEKLYQRLLHYRQQASSFFSSAPLFNENKR